MKSISSRQNPVVRRVREALREHADEIALEGPKTVTDALAKGWTPITILTTDESLEVPSAAHRSLVAVTPEVFASVAETRAPQGVIGLFERPRFEAAPILRDTTRIAVALDGVQDPGNVGTIVRLAAAFDTAGVLLLPGCADAYGPKAIRASVGTILDVPVASITADELLAARVPLFAAAADGAPLDPPARGAVLVFGNEGAGVSAQILRHATHLAIPMSDRVESLNVASSAAILLAASYRSRQ